MDYSYSYTIVGLWFNIDPEHTRFLVDTCGNYCKLPKPIVYVSLLVGIWGNHPKLGGVIGGLPQL